MVLKLTYSLSLNPFADCCWSQLLFVFLHGVMDAIESAGEQTSTLATININANRLFVSDVQIEGEFLQSQMLLRVETG